MKTITNKRSVLLYINPDELVITPNGTVVGGVRAELSDKECFQSVHASNPRPNEEFSNAHGINKVQVFGGVL